MEVIKQRNLTEKQVKAVELLALKEVEEMTMEEIAQEVGVTRKCLYDWLSVTEFKRAVNRRALDCMADYSPLLLKELKSLIKSKNETVKLRAIEIVSKSIDAQEQQHRKENEDNVDIDAFMREIGIL